VFTPNSARVFPCWSTRDFAFSHLTETTLETANPVKAGDFVGIRRPTADIGGFKIIALGSTSTGFTIDDFSSAAPQLRCPSPVRSCCSVWRCAPCARRVEETPQQIA
jgi:hypothetical protein